jgi:hypothetical protein
MYESITLLFGAVSIAGLHAAVPSHWLSFTIIGRAQGWSRAKAVGITAIAGLGHITTTTIAGLLIVLFGIGIESIFVGVTEKLASILLFGMGILYILLQIRKRSRPHIHLPDKVAILSLIALLTFSPCEALLIVFFAASTLGFSTLLSLILINASVTLFVICLLVFLSYPGIEKMKLGVLEKYEKLILGIVLIVLGCIFSFHHLTERFPLIIYGILKKAWYILNKASPYLLIGFSLAGLIHIFIDPGKISKFLGVRRASSVFYAALFGIPLPLCSCGVLPVAYSLRKQGASKGATISFLISTPESGIDSILLTYGLMGLPIAIFRPVSAFVIATTAGLIENLFGSKEEVYKEEPRCAVDGCTACEDHHHRLSEKIAAGMRYAYINLLGDISKWLIIGILVAAFITFFVPDSLIKDHLGGGIYSMVLMLIFGIPFYICAVASTPIAAALAAKGASLGACLVFLLAGPATNIASLTVILRFLGKRATTIYLCTIAVLSILLGLLFDWLSLSLSLTPNITPIPSTHDIPSIVNIASSIILLILMVVAMKKRS